MTQPFRIGVSPDFYEEALAHLELVTKEKISALPNIEIASMGPLDGIHATPESMQGFDAIFALAVKIDASSLVGVTRPAIVARWGVGYDRIDVPALTASDVVLTITPNGVKRPVSEAIFAFILALSKNMFIQDRITRAGGWRGQLPGLGVSIKDKVLGSVGCGNIGQEMFRMSHSMGFSRRIACDPFIRQEQVASLGVEVVDMDTVFRESDFVAVNTFLNPSTENLVQERHFRLMKRSAYFINTARGPIVQHDALVKALTEKWIAGAGIDVFPVEPPPKDDPLFSLDNVIVAPHAMAWTHELMRDNGFEAADNVLMVSRGEAPGGVVNREVLDRPGFKAKLERWR